MVASYLVIVCCNVRRVRENIACRRDASAPSIRVIIPDRVTVADGLPLRK